MGYGLWVMGYGLFLGLKLMKIRIGSDCFGNFIEVEVMEGGAEIADCGIWVFGCNGFSVPVVKN